MMLSLCCGLVGFQSAPTSPRLKAGCSQLQGYISYSSMGGHCFSVRFLNNCHLLWCYLEWNWILDYWLLLQLKGGNGEDFFPRNGRWNFNNKVFFWPRLFPCISFLDSGFVDLVKFDVNFDSNLWFL